MTVRRRLLLYVLVVVCLVCAMLGVLATLPPGSGVTAANYDRIEMGMTSEEVKAILGEPSVDFGHIKGWKRADGTLIAVQFRFTDDRALAIDKTFNRSTETFTDKLRRWFFVGEQEAPNSLHLRPIDR